MSFSTLTSTLTLPWEKCTEVGVEVGVGVLLCSAAPKLAKTICALWLEVNTRGCSVEVHCIGGLMKGEQGHTLDVFDVAVPFGLPNSAMALSQEC